MPSYYLTNICIIYDVLYDMMVSAGTDRIIIELTLKSCSSLFVRRHSLRVTSTTGGEDRCILRLTMAQEYVVIETKCGRLKGQRVKSVLGKQYYNFLGIPYAEPPVGELRFQTPKPITPWKHVLDATSMPPVAAIPDMFIGTFHEGSSEDCLYLSVFINELPQEVKKPKAVMVYIHGGGFDSGSGNMMGPDYLMQHDIIHVNVNYRVGALGFLSTETSECPGNFGLKDQVEALRWVKQNISSFGGNPENITLFGESAGGASVNYLLLAPKTKGLFNKAICQSGSVLNAWAFTSIARRLAFALGKRLGCDTNDEGVLLACLKKAPVKDIIEKSYRLLDEVDGLRYGESMLHFPFVPTIEPAVNNPDAIITEHPQVLVERGAAHDVPLIVGCNTLEGLVCLPTGEVSAPSWTKVSEYQSVVPRSLRLPLDSEGSLRIAQILKDFYFPNGITLEKFVDCFSDPQFVHGCYKTAKSHAAHKKSPTYFYVFTHNVKNALKQMFHPNVQLEGSCHGDDLSVLFYLIMPPEYAAMQSQLKQDSPDFKVMENLTKIITEFAQTGTFSVKWDKLEKQDRKLKYLTWGLELGMKDDFPVDRMEVWDNIYNIVNDYSIKHKL